MYAVAGVSGHTGAVVASRLLEAGKQVRVIVRDAAKGESWKKRGAQVAIASLSDVEAVGAALAGVEGAYVLVPPDMGAKDPSAHGRAIAGALAKAIGDARVPHVVLLSSIGAQHTDGTGPIKQLHHAETLFSKIYGTRCTFLRAASFLENLGSSVAPAKNQGVVPSLVTPSKKLPMVATEDIGEVAARALLEAPKASEIIELAGPQEYSFDDAAAAFAAVLGKPVKTVHVPEKGILPALAQAGLPAPMAELYREMSVGLEKGIVAWEGGKARQMRGKITLEAMAKKLLS